MTLRRRLSWLVIATTSTVVVSFVIPLCLLVRNLAEERAVSATDQEARNIAIVVASTNGRYRQTGAQLPEPRRARGPGQRSPLARRSDAGRCGRHAR